MRPTRHRLHLAPALDDLGVYVWVAPLDPGDTLTTAGGRRFKVVTIVELGPGAAVDRLAEVEPDTRAMREMRSKECVEGRDHGLEGGRLAA